MRCAAFVLVLACGSQSPEVTGDEFASAQHQGLASGELTVLTYNVAGLPSAISASDPKRNTARISPLLSAYDLVLVQEDFWYHDSLIAHAVHPYKSAPYRNNPRLTDIGDGLNQLSTHAFSDFQRIAWTTCHGTLSCEEDCLASKGFTHSSLLLNDGTEAHVYNVHFDAGGCQGDSKARSQQVDQLIAFISLVSPHVPLIIAGDTNMYRSRPGDPEAFARLLAKTGAEDVCATLGCSGDTIDRIMLRSSDAVSLTPLTFAHPTEFVDAQRNPLSDHVPTSARIAWSRAQ